MGYFHSWKKKIKNILGFQTVLYFCSCSLRRTHFTIFTINDPWAAWRKKWIFCENTAGIQGYSPSAPWCMVKGHWQSANIAAWGNSSKAMKAHGVLRAQICRLVFGFWKMFTIWCWQHPGSNDPRVGTLDELNPLLLGNLSNSEVQNQPEVRTSLQPLPLSRM